jgi:malate synthase
MSLAPVPREAGELLGPEAERFVAGLVARHAPALETLLARRSERRSRWARGERLGFLRETRPLRESDWRVAGIPGDLVKRIVEITGPVERKMIINALNSGADVFMADFEDATAPTWDNMVLGQVHLRDAVRGVIAYDDPVTGKAYRLGQRPATLMVRPRGLHLVERHARVGGRPVPGALFDFGLFLFHNAELLRRRGSGPYFYLPKLESHHEAAWWNDVFRDAQATLGLEPGTIRATVLIETLPAAFEMHEILHALREHSAGLNCGRWDYIFSFIKAHRLDPAAVLPDRSQITMEQPFLRSYTRLAVETCHRRGIHAIGGMAAQIPIKDDEQANRVALERVRKDKLREVGDGHDGTWVAHPALVPVAREVFAAHMSGSNQLDRPATGFEPTADALLQIPSGTRTEAGLRWNIRVGIRYLEAWLRGQGCVPLYGLMEDAATAEISRTQVWQWLRHDATLEDGRTVTPELVARLTDEELERIRAEVGESAARNGRLPEARALFERLCLSEELPEFLTLSAYELLGGETHAR